MSPDKGQDPDPFAETPLTASERRGMLEKLSAYIRPRTSDMSGARSRAVRALWEQLREQETVESFQSVAESLLDLLDQPDTGQLAEAAPDAQSAGPTAVSEPVEKVDTVKAGDPVASADAPGSKGGPEDGLRSRREVSDASRASGQATNPPEALPGGARAGSSIIETRQGAAIAIGVAVVVLIAVIALALQAGSKDSGSAEVADATATPTYLPPVSLTREIRNAGLNPAKFEAACLNQNYERLQWFHDRIPVQITCLYHAGVDLDTGSRVNPPRPRYEVSLANRDKLRFDFGITPAGLRRTCLAIAREFRASSLRGSGDGDTYWQIAERHHLDSIVAYTETGDVYSGSRLDPCIRFADVDPWWGAAPYFVASGKAKNDRDGLVYDWS